MANSVNGLAYLIGAGSFSLGVEQAGVRVVQVIETPGYSRNARSWDLNRPELRHQVLELDHTSTYFDAYRGHGLDLLYGNPPCGGVSSMTNSRITSPTNDCMRQWVRMVVRARPRMLLMENGYQLATPCMAPLLQDLGQVLDEAGYWWWTWCFYSYQLGTPQIRRRMFLCASLDQPRRPRWVELDDLPLAKEKSTAPCKPWLEDLYGVAPSPDPVQTRRGEVVTQHWYGYAGFERYNSLLAVHRARLLKPYYTPKDWRRMQRYAEAGDERYARELKLRTDVYWPDCPKEFQGMSFHRPTPVHEDRASGAIVGAFRYVHPRDDRFLTMREMARLMTYPDHWQFHELKPHLIAQGIPVLNARWATERLLRTVGLED